MSANHLSFSIKFSLSTLCIKWGNEILGRILLYVPTTKMSSLCIYEKMEGSFFKEEYISAFSISCSSPSCYCSYVCFPYSWIVYYYSWIDFPMISTSTYIFPYYVSSSSNICTSPSYNLYSLGLNVSLIVIGTTEGGLDFTLNLIMALSIVAYNICWAFLIT